MVDATAVGQHLAFGNRSAGRKEDAHGFLVQRDIDRSGVSILIALFKLIAGTVDLYFQGNDQGAVCIFQLVGTYKGSCNIVKIREVNGDLFLDLNGAAALGIGLLTGNKGRFYSIIGIAGGLICNHHLGIHAVGIIEAHIGSTHMHFIPEVCKHLINEGGDVGLVGILHRIVEESSFLVLYLIVDGAAFCVFNIVGFVHPVVNQERTKGNSHSNYQCNGLNK